MGPCWNQSIVAENKGRPILVDEQEGFLGGSDVLIEDLGDEKVSAI